MNGVRWIAAVVLGLVLTVVLMDTASVVGSPAAAVGPADLVLRGLVLLGGVALIAVLIRPRRRSGRPAPPDREQPR